MTLHIYFLSIKFNKRKIITGIWNRNNVGSGSGFKKIVWIRIRSEQQGLEILAIELFLHLFILVIIRYKNFNSIDFNVDRESIR